MITEDFKNSMRKMAEEEQERHLTVRAEEGATRKTVLKQDLCESGFSNIIVEEY